MAARDRLGGLSALTVSAMVLMRALYDIVLIEGAVPEVPQAIADQLAEGGRLATVIADPSGALGVAHLFVKQGGVMSGRPLFDAGTPLLPGFARPARFTF